jgi:hypothetical protein
VASGHGWFGFGLTPDAAGKCVKGLGEAAEKVRRPPELGELEVSVTPRHLLDAAALEAFDTAGVHRVVVNTIGSATVDEADERMRSAASLQG